MSAYPEGENLEAGVWMLIPDVQQKKMEAVLGCPNCGTPLSLHAHEIDDQGLVFPKVECTETHCAYDQYVELKGWNPYANMPVKT